jgi:hypothetical protein
MDELERAPEDTAGVVDLLGGHRQPLLVREGEDGGDATIGIDLADPDWLVLSGRRPDGTEQQQKDAQQAD